MKPVPFGLETVDLSRLEEKVAAHAVRYGKGAAILRGRVAHSVIVDELRAVEKRPKYETEVDDGLLDDKGWAWAVAFRKVLGVGPQFYERAPFVRRQQLEQHYQLLATHDTANGRRAAKVVAAFVEYSLRGRQQVEALNWSSLPEFKTHGSVTGRMANDQLDAYRLLYQQIPEKP